MEAKKLNVLLEIVANETTKRAILPEYQKKISQAKALGLALSNYFEYDGVAIMELSAEALEDANFHHEAKILRDIIEKYK